jgi:hypothetical protein
MLDDDYTLSTGDWGIISVAVAILILIGLVKAIFAAFRALTRKPRKDSPSAPPARFNPPLAGGISLNTTVRYYAPLSPQLRSREEQLGFSRRILRGRRSIRREKKLRGSNSTERN